MVNLHKMFYIEQDTVRSTVQCYINTTVAPAFSTSVCNRLVRSLNIFWISYTFSFNLDIEGRSLLWVSTTDPIPISLERQIS